MRHDRFNNQISKLTQRQRVFSHHVSNDQNDAIHDHSNDISINE